MMTGRLQSLRSALVDETQCFVATHAGHMDVQPHNTRARHVTSGHLMVQTSHALFAVVHSVQLDAGIDIG